MDRAPQELLFKRSRKEMREQEVHNFLGYLLAALGRSRALWLRMAAFPPVERWRLPGEAPVVSSVVKSGVSYIFLFFFKDCIYLFLEIRGGRERNIDVREKHPLVASCTCIWGLNPQLRQVC